MDETITNAAQQELNAEQTAPWKRPHRMLL